MKNKTSERRKMIGAGPARIKAIVKELHKTYGPMLKRLAG
jgi:hypothetical protein